jgi:hypothetical protein
VVGKEFVMPSFATGDVLLLISQIAGILLLGCTMLLVGLRRIYFDAETKQPTEIELPFFGKVRTQAPAILLILIAAALVLYPLTKATQDEVTLEGDVQTRGEEVIVAVEYPNSEQALESSGHFTMQVPSVKGAVYRVKYEISKQIVADQEPTLKAGKLQLKPFTYSAPASPPGELTTTAKIRKDVSDETLRQYKIPN